MANGSKQLFEGMRKRGLTDRDAFFAVIDHHFGLILSERDRYHKMVKALEERVNALEAR